MLAAAYLYTFYARQRLKAAIGGTHNLTFVSSWPELEDLIRRLPVEIVVADPCRPEGIEVGAIERLRAYYPSLSVVLYMPFSPDLADALLRLGQVRVHSAVFLDHGDTSLALSKAVAEAAGISTSEHILARVFDEVEVDCAAIQEAFRVALNNVDKVRTVIEWSRFSGVPQRSFYRLFRSNSLPTPKTCLTWLRLMYAAKLLQDPGYDLCDIVHRLAYGAPSNFWQHVQATLGLRASELRHGVGFEALLERFLYEHVRPPSERRRATG